MNPYLEALQTNQPTATKTVSKPVVSGNPYLTALKTPQATPTTPLVSPFGTVHKLQGGGALNIGTNTNQLINTDHTTYGGIPTKKGYERADIVPVSLGGSNQAPENITYEPYSTVEKIKDKLFQLGGKNYVPQTATDKYLKKEILPAYKSGKITLNEARVKAIGFLDDQQKGLKKSTLANLPGVLPKSVAETVGGLVKAFISPAVSFGVSTVNLGTQVGATISAGLNGEKTVPNYIGRSFKIPVYGKAEPMFSGEENLKEGIKKIVGNALEIAPNFMGIPEARSLGAIIDTVGAKALGQITKKEGLNFAKAMGTKVATSALGLGSMFGLGTSLKEGSDVKETATNVAKSVATIALLELTLSPLIKYGMKLKGGTVKQNVEKVLEDHQELIAKKAEEIKAELEPKSPFQTTHEKIQREAPITPAETAEIKTATPFGQVHEQMQTGKPVESVGKYQTIHEGGEIKTVEGKPVKIVDGVDTFLHEGDGGWIVSEASTGRFISESRSKEGAVAKANFILSDIPKDQLLKTIQENKLVGSIRPEREGVSMEVKPTETVSGVAKQIEAKAIEKGMVEKGYTDLAGYDASTIKAQAEMASKMDIEQIKRIATGREGLPEGMKPGTPLSIAEDHALKTKDSQLLVDLAKSPLATQISESGSELSLSRMRDKESAVAQIKKVSEARQSKFKEKIKSEVKKIKEEIKKSKPTKDAWASFVDEITC